MPKLISDSGTEYGSVKEAEFVNPRRGAVIDPEHPVAVAYEKSWEDETVLEIATSDPAVTVKLLRKYAQQTDRGVRVQEKDASVVFAAKERKRRAPKNP